MKYDTYRESGVQWIGKVPSCWQKSRLKFLFSHANSGVWGEDEKGDSNDIACFRVADFDYQTGYLGFDKLTMRNISPKELEGRLLTENSLLIEKSGGGDATPVGRVVRFNYTDKATCSNFVHFVCVDALHVSDFLYYYFYAMYANKENLLYFNQTTGIQNLKIGEYLGQSIYVPSLAEQQGIASYLDDECGKINNAIEVQKKKIDLLNELKQTLITTAVTKGLDSNADLKESGIQWIGKVPSCWQKSRLKFLFSHANSGVWGEDEKGDSNDIACFRVADFDYQTGYLGFDKLTMRNISPHELEGRLLTENSLLIEKSGGGDVTPVGRVVRFNYNDKATCSNFVHFVCVDALNDSDYLYYYFYAMYANKENLLYFNQTTGIQNLKIGEYLGQTIYVPSLAEQQSIASYLDDECGKINNAIEVRQKKINLLNELKQSIITEAVTGKIKVC